MDELVDGYSKFTALADEASKGVSVDGVKNPLGYTAGEGAAALIPATPTPGFGDASGETQFESPASSRAVGNSASTSSRRLRRARSALAASAPGGDNGDSDRRFGAGTATASAVERSPMLASGFTGMQGSVDGIDASGRLVDPVQDPVARDALKLLFAKEGNYVQVRRHGAHWSQRRCSVTFVVAPWGSPSTIHACLNRDYVKYDKITLGSTASQTCRGEDVLPPEFTNRQ